MSRDDVRDFIIFIIEQTRPRVVIDIPGRNRDGRGRQILGEGSIVLPRVTL